jgi:hypothetical protein
LRCADCGHTAHYDGKLRVVRHDDPLLQARGCPGMTGRHEEPYGEEAVPHGGGRDTAPDWVDGWVAAADDPGCYTFGPYPAQTRTDAILTHHRGIRTREGTAPGPTREAGFADSVEDPCPGEQPEHDCQAADTLEYVAQYGAPGIGQAWHCTVCGRAWSRIGGIFSPAESGAHILSPQDVE